MALLIFNVCAATLLCCRVATAVGTGTVRLYSCSNAMCDWWNDDSSCRLSNKWSFDDMDGQCHQKKTNDGLVIGYRHFCADGRYYRYLYPNIECYSNGNCLCSGKPRSIPSSGCFFNRDAKHPSHPYEEYWCVNRDAYQLGVAEGEGDKGGLPAHMYVIGFIVSLAVFMLGIFGGYRYWFRRRKKNSISDQSMSADLTKA